MAVASPTGCSRLGCSALTSERVAELVQAGTDRAVEDGVADLGDDAAQDGRVHDVADGDCRCWSWPRAPRSGAVMLVVGERHGRADLGDGLAASTRRSGRRPRRRSWGGRRRGRRPTIIETNATVVALALPSSRSSTICWPALHREVRVGQRGAQLVVRLRRTRPRRNSSSSTSARLPSADGDGERGVGVGVDAGSRSSCSLASVLGPDLVDVVVDQALLGGVVERASTTCSAAPSARRDSSPARSASAWIAGRREVGGRPAPGALTTSASARAAMSTVSGLGGLTRLARGCARPRCRSRRAQP